MKKNIFNISLVLFFALTACNSNNTLILEGKVKRETISLAPKIAGRIVKINVNESDTVKAGDTIAILNIPEIDAKIMQAEGAVLSASSQYEMALNGATKEEKEQVIAAYNAALEQFKFAEKSLKRVKSMYNDSLISAQSYDEAFMKFNAAQKQLEGVSAKKNEVMKGLRSEKVKMAEGQKKQASGALKEANTAYAERYIIAPKDMTIETIALKEGELALPGYNIFIGYDQKTTYFRFTLTESQLEKAKKGTIYDIELPFQKKTVKAKLVSIVELSRYAYKTTAFPNYKMGETVYELKLEPVDIKDADGLYNNFTSLLKLN